jgi:hypothetical protein
MQLGAIRARASYKGPLPMREYDTFRSLPISCVALTPFLSREKTSLLFKYFVVNKI